jgi:hypothetical protein
MAVDISIKNLDPKFILKVRDQKFYVEMWMYNQLDTFKPIPVPVYFIEKLVIDEKLDIWNTNGYVILSNNFEIFERGALGDNSNGNNNFGCNYLFRSDGRNKISLKIYPVMDDGVELDPKYWEMNYDFIIYDIEDIPNNDASQKFKKFYFHDERYQTLLERNIEWSTSDNEYQLINSNAKDDVRALNTSLAIQSIIRTAASNESNPNSPTIKIGNKLGPSEIANPNVPLDNIDGGDWDTGYPDNKILYTSPANSCALNDLNYALEFAKSKDKSPLFLFLSRYNRQWSLVSLKEMLKRGSDNQIERFLLADGATSGDKNKPYVNRAPIEGSSFIKNFQSGLASIINGYRFVPMVNIDDLNLVNTPLHKFDFNSCAFNMNYKGNLTTDLLTKMKEDVEDSLYSFQLKQGQLLMHLNKTKTSGLNTKNTFTSRTFIPTDSSYLKMAKEFLFLNQAIYFSTIGLTFRTPGMFIFIDRKISQGDPNVFDDKFLGQWLITKVTHVFTKSSYDTEIIANKIDSFNKWWKEIEDKY